MSKVSILIPVRSEKVENLERTLTSVYGNATGEIEVIVGLDGEKDGEVLELMEKNRDDSLKFIFFPDVVGIKTNINAMAAMATGEYLMKLDAHCSVGTNNMTGEGIDEVLKREMRDNDIIVPRFAVLNGETWEWQDDRYYDYFYLCCPFTDPRGFRFKAGGHWPEKTKEKADQFEHLDETPQIHGSCWFMKKDRFFELEGFPNVDIAGHAQEPIWLAMKNWMAGGRVMVNKSCWYAHMHKNGDKDRGYHIPNAQNEKSYNLAAEFFVNDKWNDTWPKKVMSFEQFVDKFMPMPTWPENWKELLHDYQKSYNK